ncbi:hypothetical protein NC651_026275 [Populus alba x Populus x berolinensis]|nr:hypothetical protein NC651_026275 [Populus alba x Populus x berolinensis]
MYPHWAALRASDTITLPIPLEFFKATLVYAGTKSNTARIIVITVVPAVGAGALPSGQEIAVKRLSKDSGQGDHRNDEMHPHWLFPHIANTFSTGIFYEQQHNQSDLSSSMGHNSRVTESSLSENENVSYQIENGYSHPKTAPLQWTLFIFLSRTNWKRKSRSAPHDASPSSM